MITDKEKQKLGYEAVNSFLKQFEPIDDKTKMFLEILFEMLRQQKKTNYNR